MFAEWLNKAVCSGAGNGTRTHDLRITNALLYQLSYTSKNLQKHLQSTVGIFKSSSPKQVYDETERLLHVTTDFDNFIISTGCDVPPGVSLENINAFYRAVEIFRNRH